LHDFYLLLEREERLAWLLAISWLILSPVEMWLLASLYYGALQLVTALLVTAFLAFFGFYCTDLTCFANVGFDSSIL